MAPIIWILSNADERQYENARLLKTFVDHGYRPVLVHVDSITALLEHGKSTIKLKHLNTKPPDVLLVRHGAGITGAALTVIRVMADMGVLVVNTADAIALTADKLHSGYRLAKEGIAIPRTMPIGHPFNSRMVAEEIGFPCVVKARTGSYGQGVFLCGDGNQLAQLDGMLSAVNNTSGLLVQQFIPSLPVRDLRVLVIGDTVIGAMLRSAPPGDFRSNISGGGVGKSYPLTPEIRSISLATTRCLGLDIAGVDLLFDGDTFRVCEANSNPGFAGFEQYCTTDVANHIVAFISSKLGHLTGVG